MSKKRLTDNLTLREKIEKKVDRRLKGLNKDERSLWFGLGMFGLVGWSVAIPTLIGVAVGLWLDLTFPGRPLWTLMLLVAGVIIGSLNAWYWIKKELDKNNEE